MSPQEGEERFLEEYHGEKEQKKLKAVEANPSVDLTIEDSFKLMHGESDNSSDCVGMQYYESPSFEEESSNKKISSPAPVVEKGGENEFVKVSHLASVQVKAVPTLSVSKKKLEKPEQSNRTRRGLQKMPEHDVSLPSRSSKKKLRGSSQRRHKDDDESNSPYGEENPYNESSLEMLIEIEKSPYEPGKCAESGESLFEEMKTLLLEDDDDDNSQAVQIFGPTNAGCLVKANSLIERSGMLYSQTWNKGSIRGDPVGIIPNHLLLMVLVPNRFAKASELLLSGLSRDLEVYESVNRGLDDWGWAEEYMLVRATKKNYKFKGNKRDCFKCAVFVARAHSCFLSFGKRELEPRLIKKLRTCLDMMEDHLITPSANGHNGHATSSTISSAKKRKKMTPDRVLSTSSLVPHSAHASTESTLSITKNSSQLPDPPVKRKRGRPPKSSKQQLTQQISSSMQSQCTENESMKEGKELESSRSKRHHLHSVRGESRTGSSDSSLISRRVSSSLSGPSLHELMSRFEAQYKEMGQRYAEMGTLLAQMKTAIDDKRTPSEQEIRKELLGEIQRNILESLPKR